jgi:hypothetical protein
MKDIVYCGFNDVYSEKKYPDSYIIIQVLNTKGSAVIGKRIFPLIAGACLFLDGDIPFKIKPADEETYLENRVVISKNYINNLGELMDFKDNLSHVFPCYIPIKHYKTINDRYKIMAAEFISEESFAKAKLTSHILALLNYGVYASEKMKDKTR